MSDNLKDFKKLYVDMLDGFLSMNGVINPDEHSAQLPYTSLNKTLLDSYSNAKNKEWENLISIMNTQFDYNIPHDNEEDRTGIRYGDYPNENFQSIIEFIAKNIDIDKDVFTQRIQNPEWNSSINYLIDKYKQVNRRIINDRYLNETITGEELKKGDAAYSDNFNSESSKKLHLVKPSLNVDKKSYRLVRGKDNMNIPSVNLYESKRTNFQHESSEKNNWAYLRLIMPNYLRRIEIEDLDRNFWVISQTLSGLCDLLFKNPILYKEPLYDILNELPQLWENIAYLWVQMAVLSQKEYNSDIQTIFLPLFNNQNESYIKFDNFELIDFDDIDNLQSETLLNIAKENCKNLLSQYPNTNLLIIPEFRLKNYQHNYYSAALYPGLIFYNINNESWIKVGVEDLRQTFIDLTDSNDVIAKNLSGVREQNHTYAYVDNYNNPTTGVIGYFYGLARVQLNINSILTQNGLNIENFSLKFYDVNRIENNLNGLAGEINFQSMTEITEDNFNLVAGKTGYVLSDSLPNTIIPIIKGHYLGEILSGLPHLNLRGDLKVILFSQNQTDSNRNIQWTWDEYNSSNNQSDLERRWNIVIDNEKNELEKGDGRFLLRRVVCVNKNNRNQNVVEICDNFCFIFRQLNGEIVEQAYDIAADYTNAPAQKKWTEVDDNNVEYTIDKVIVSAVPSDVIGKHSTIYLGSMIDGVAIKNPENHTQGFIRYLNENKTSTWESLINKSQFYPLLNDEAYFWKWISTGTTDYPVTSEDYYGGLIHDDTDLTALYVSEYEINQRYENNINWIENPPATFTEQEEQIDRHSLDYAYPFSKVSTFTFSHGEVDTSQNQWRLKPFYIIVIDRAYTFSNNKQDKIAYYYKCELAERENGDKYLKATFKYFGDKQSKFNKTVFDNCNEDYIKSINFDVEGVQVTDRIKRLMIKSEELEEVLE